MSHESANTFPADLNKPEVKSTLKKYLTREVFEQLKDKKTARGTILQHCINSGVVNLDSGVSVYAGDEECYTLFAPLFTPIVEEYHHPYKLSQKHQSNMDPSQVDALLRHSFRCGTRSTCLFPLLPACNLIAKGSSLTSSVVQAVLSLPASCVTLWKFEP